MDYSAKELDLIALDSIKELNYKLRQEITDNFTYSRPQKKYSANLIKTLGEGVYNKVKEDFYDQARRDRHLKELEKKGVTCVTYFSESYPKQLRSIPVPPCVLYCKGDVSLLKTRLFCVVGSRSAQMRSLKFCSDISGKISREFTIITGLADGADSAAASGAIEAGGKVIGVLAFGFDYIYPSANSALFKKVEQNGLLISENLPDVQPRRYLFPVRNRILAGLCEGVLVTAAGAKSGACITAEYAFRYGRDVFSVPYTPGSPAGEGCNKLIKKGAYLTENILDIFGAFGLDFNAQKGADLTEREQRILDAIRAEGEAHISRISAAVGCPSYELLADLSSLEVKKVIMRLGGNRYSAL
ncbi:MAG: DNA-processing protein DprA [Clostridia bacterium]|nr:DNA-processing protein DprA [Clostridia bacterium]MCD8309146.1 DNA-processing protein DprA [Clostridia bacterium]